jgi:hypothetical protein
MKFRLFVFGLFLFGSLMLVPAASALPTIDVYQTYNLAWSGASFENSASATGQITLDLTTLPNPSSGTIDIYTDIQSLTVTVTGAGSGDGTWTMTDLIPGSFLATYTYWDTGGATLNMGTELVGQPTVGNAWGTPDGSSGDFNLFFGNGGPNGVAPFTLATAGEGGDQMLLTEFDPVSETPEPGSFILLGSGLAALAGMARRKIGQRA